MLSSFPRLLTWPRRARKQLNTSKHCFRSFHCETLEYRRLLSATPQLLKDINLATEDSNPTELVELNGELFFGVYDADTASYEIWKTDGTTAGTVQVADIVSGTGDSHPMDMTVMGDKLFFNAYTPASGSELWKSDGTSAGTVQVADIYTGTGSSNPTRLTVSGDRLFFAADDGETGSEPWTIQQEQPPVAFADLNYRVAQGETLVVEVPGGVLQNDSDPNEDTLSAVLETGPQQGQLTLNPDGTFTYRPLPQFIGFGSFTYRATDGVYQSDPAMVRIAVGDVLAEAGGSYVINQGANLFLDASQSVDLENDPLNFTWDVNGDETFGDAQGMAPVVGWSALLSLGINRGRFNVTVRVDDGFGHSRTDSTTLTVNNAVPAVNAGADTRLAEGGNFAASGWFDDLGADSWTATVDYGDGTPAVPLALHADKTFDLSHLYADNGQFTVTVTVDDGQAGGADSVMVTVDNRAPTVEVGTDQGATVGAVVTLSQNVQFGDVGTYDTHTATINWGDGTEEAGSVTENNGSGTVVGSHVYTAAGIYEVKLTVTDDDGGWAYDSLVVAVDAPVVRIQDLEGVQIATPFTVEQQTTDLVIHQSDPANPIYSVALPVPGLLIYSRDVSDSFHVNLAGLSLVNVVTGIWIRRRKHRQLR